MQTQDILQGEAFGLQNVAVGWVRLASFYVLPAIALSELVTLTALAWRA